MPKRRFSSSNPLELPSIKTVVRDGVQLRVEQYTKRCGHPGYFVELAICFDGPDEWRTMALIPGEELHVALGLLTEATKHIDGLQSERCSISVKDD